MSIKLKGFDDFSKTLKQLQKNAKLLHGNHEIPFSELFPNTFMQRNTVFRNIEDMFDRSPFSIVSEEDFINIPQVELDQFVSTKTKFSTWESMKEKAVSEWTALKLGL